MECELIRRKDRSELAPTCTAPGEMMHAAGTREGEGEPRTLMRGPRTLTPP